LGKGTDSAGEKSPGQNRDRQQESRTEKDRGQESTGQKDGGEKDDEKGHLTAADISYNKPVGPTGSIGFLFNTHLC
jgi:hypothetical protein